MSLIDRIRAWLRPDELPDIRPEPLYRWVNGQKEPESPDKPNSGAPSAGGDLRGLAVVGAVRSAVQEDPGETIGEKRATPPSLEVLQPSSDAVVVVLHGEHDLASKDSLHETFRSLIEAHRVVVADLSTVLYIDSTVIGELVRADRAARDAGKHFRLQVGTEPIVERILEISGLLTVLDWYPTRDEALDATPDKPPDRLL